ncbi:alcohol dehydrogenase cytochrome c protein [Halorhabdus tiamatea SARL4B]|uniref:Alcohol dehydrogenase cytochrome c protein n=1 Tax=Halorhabdus tiamatea SARL4B TaxID=1033806 RepID=U2FI06_9EURY|nr:alcohol dehydrogenase cytochrome c protein [Halorhabdus tiamatea SARL4B]
MFSSPTIADGTVFVGSGDNNVYSLDGETGKENWHFETGGWVRSSPIVVDGTVFVGSRDSKVYALEADVSGSSEGSRTRLGTLNHHDDWRYADQSIEPKEEDQRQEDGLLPWLGAGGTAAGLGGAAYLYRRHKRSTDGHESTE